MVDVSTLTVRDLMRTEVITVPEGATVAELMRVLSRHGIGGVPVVGGDGAVVGVVSAADVVAVAGGRSQGRGGAASEPSTPPLEVPLEVKGPFTPPGERGGYFGATEELPQGVEAVDAIDRIEALAVAEIMTPATFRIGPEATVPELARLLVRSRIHRALVFDGARLAGIVSSTDVLRAIAGEVF